MIRWQQLGMTGKWLLGLLFLALVSIAVRQLAKTPLGLRKRMIFSFLSAIILTIVTLVFLQGHSVFFKQEGAVISKVNEFKKGLGLYDKADSNYFTQHFIFINTASSPSLVPLATGDAEDSSMQVITNRRQLTDLFSFLDAIRGKLAMVACDIVFPDPGAGDTALIKSILPLQQDNKIVLAYNRQIAQSNPFIYERGLDPASLGDVTKVIEEAFYFSHTLVNEQAMPSLPYALWMKLRKGPEDKKIIFHNFITEFNFTDENKLYGIPEPVNAGPLLKTAPDSSLQNALPAGFYTLGRSISEDGKQEIMDRIALLQQSGIQPIFFIGNINNEYTDRHDTPFGLRSGSTLLLNEFYYISKGYYGMGIGQYILYILTLLACFFTNVSWMLWKAGKDDTRIEKKKPVVAPAPKKGLVKWWADTKAWVLHMFGFVLDEFHHLWLFLFVFLVAVCFHKLINVMGLIYIFVVFSALLKYHIKNAGTPKK